MSRTGPFLCGVVLLLAAGTARAADRPPNVVVVFADDLGSADLGCTGGKPGRTPRLDRMAAEGVRLTNFSVAQAVCSASRAALLTGCYPNRVGIQGALNHASKVGIADGERTIAEVLKPRGYATACFGKWHLGHHPQFLPTRHGFDEYFGLPYSNDMWPKHPTGRFPDLPLIDGERVVEHNPDQRKLTAAYTERAVDFIGRNAGRPFFLYLAHSMPHVPLFVSDRHAGSTGDGVYADVIREIDWSVGRVLDAVRNHGLDGRTLVVFTSDNGPWLSYGDHAGSAGRLREGKGTTFEGGVRVPFVARWPGVLPAGAVVDTPAMTIDLLPTVAKLVGAELPAHPIDGKDVGPLLRNEPGAKSPHEAYFFWWGRELQAVRSGRWKLHLPHNYQAIDTPGGGGRPGKYRTARIELALFDLDADPGESMNVADKHPDVVGRLRALADGARAELGDSATKTAGRGGRQPGTLAGP